MKNRPHAEISESEESETDTEQRQSIGKNVGLNNHEDPSSDSSSEPEERRRPPSPPVEKRKLSESPQKKVTFNPLEKFLSKNEHLKKLFVGDFICEDDDVCILEIPTTIDPSEFLEKLINFDKKTKLKLDKTKYIIEPELEERRTNLVNEKLKIIHPISILKLRKYKKNKHESEAVNSATIPPSLPENLKVRHPLFGSEYKRKIVLSEEIQKKLDNSLEEAVKKMKKKKKKKHKEENESRDFNDFSIKKKHKKRREKDTDNEESFRFKQESAKEEDIEESIFSLLETHVTGKNKNKSFNEDESFACDSNVVFRDTNTSESSRKHKNSFTEQSAVNLLKSPSINFDFEEKKKKRKNSIKEEKMSSQDTAESQLDFSETEKPLKRKKHKSSFQNESESFAADTSFENENIEVKAKKKYHNNIKNETFSQDEMEDPDDSFKYAKRKRNNSKLGNSLEKQTNRRNSIVNSTMIPDLELPLFEFDVSGAMNKEEQGIHNSIDTSGTPKKKKDKSFESEEGEDRKIKKKIKVERIEESMNAMHDESKIKHTKQKETMDFVTSETEDNNSSPKKKHKKIKKEKVEEEDDEATSSLILNLLNKVKSEMGSSSKPKKKRKSEN